MKQSGGDNNMRTIKGDLYGLCDVCNKYKPTVCFNSRETGYYGWDVDFEICQDCTKKLIEKEFDRKRVSSD